MLWVQVEQAKAKFLLEVPKIVREKLEDLNKQLTMDESIECMMGCIEAGSRNALNAQGKDLLVLIGNTGAGKSTFANYLHGCTMQWVESGVIEVDESGNKTKSIMEIGHTMKSQTLFPQVEKTDTGLVLCDCPGFFDNRGWEINVANAVNIKNTFCAAKSVRVVALINYHSIKADRGRGLREMTTMLQELLGNLQKVKENGASIFVGISQAKPEEYNPRKKEIVAIAAESVTTVVRKGHGDGMGKEYEEFMKALGNKVFVFDVMDEGGDDWWKRDEILRQIKAAQPILDPADVFRTVLTTGDERALRMLVSDMRKRTTTAVQDLRFKDAATAMQHLSQLKPIDSNFVQNLVHDVEDHIKSWVHIQQSEGTREALAELFDHCKKRQDSLEKAKSAFHGLTGDLTLEAAISRADASIGEAAERIKKAKDEMKKLAEQLKVLEKMNQEHKTQADTMRAEHAALERKLGEDLNKLTERIKAASDEEKKELQAEQDTLRLEMREELAKKDLERAKVEELWKRDTEAQVEAQRKALVSAGNAGSGCTQP
eukprot:3096626-Rhodomonas_salina.1